MKKYDFLTLGEALIDFTPNGVSEHGFPAYAQNPGGAVLNAAAVLGKYGNKSAIISKVGNDMFGEFLKEKLAQTGVDVSHMIVDNDYNTTLAFVSLKPDGDRSFAFYRKNNADVKLRADELNEKLLSDTKIFHFGGLSLVTPSYAETTVKAIKTAKAAGAVISYDPNYRASLWDSKEGAIRGMLSVMGYVDLLKISEEEAELLFGNATIEEYEDKLLSLGIKFVAITAGAKGAYYASSYIRGYVPALDVKARDTTGAGDIFWGTFLHGWLHDKPALNDKNALEACVVRATKAAGISTLKTGAVPSIPTLKEIY